jgi:hypothetical protein
VLDGVFKQVKGDLSEEAVIGGDEDRLFRGFAVEIDFGAVEAILEGGGGFFDRCPEVGRFCGARWRCGIVTGEQQEAVGQAAHAIGGFEAGFKCIAVFFRGARLLECKFRLRLDHCERSAQFVGGICGELIQPLEGAFEAGEGVIEDIGERPQFGIE